MRRKKLSSLQGDFTYGLQYAFDISAGVGYHADCLGVIYAISSPQCEKTTRRKGSYPERAQGGTATPPARSRSPRCPTRGLSPVSSLSTRWRGAGVDSYHDSLPLAYRHPDCPTAFRRTRISRLPMGQRPGYRRLPLPYDEIGGQR